MPLNAKIMEGDDMQKIVDTLPIKVQSEVFVVITLYHIYNRPTF